MSDRFSNRFGFEPAEPEVTVREDAPPALRAALVQISYEAGLKPSDLRKIVCKVFRVEPDDQNWSDFPNVDEEVRRHVRECQWYEIYDLIEAIHRALVSPYPHGIHKPVSPDIFQTEINKYFRKTGVAWTLKDGAVQVRGPESFDAPVARAVAQLEASGMNVAKAELHEALRDMSRRPEPDLTGALQHSIAALECVAREVCGDSRPTLGQLLSRHRGLIPSPLDQAVEKAWGFASEQARHVREGQQLDFAEVEFVVGLAATVSGYLAAKHTN